MDGVMLDLTAYEDMPDIDMEELLMTMTSVLSQQDMDDLLEWVENVAVYDHGPPAPERMSKCEGIDPVAMRRLRHMR